jgi:hypothetical protein
MTAAQLAVWQRARARVALLQPEVAAAVLRSFALILAALPESTVARLIAEGANERILTVLLAEAVLERATMPVRFALRDATARSFRLNVPYLPSGGRIDGTVAVVFDHLNPRVITALRSLETSVIGDLHESVRETTRETIARGLESRKAPAAIARDIRSVVGLAPKDAAAVANFQAMLERGDRHALSRLLRDRRFDQTLQKALGDNGKGLTQQQIETMTNAYRRRAIAKNAETLSRAATHSAYKLAQKQSWESAIERGIVQRGIVTRRWLHLDGQDNPRPHHEAMQGETVPIDAPYSNGDTFAGEHDPWNCHCIDIYAAA